MTPAGNYRNILPPAEVALFRSLRKAAIVLMLIFRLDQLGRSPVLITELAQLLDMERETLAGHLASLSQLNLVARAGYHDGYLLTQGGRQWALGSPLELLPGLPNEHDDGKSDIEMAEIPSLSATAVKSVVVVDNLSNRDNLTTSSDLRKAMTDFPSLPLEERMTIILEATVMLWRDPILAQGLPARSEQMVLAWIAQGWDMRDKLKFPQGLVYQSLKRGKRPIARYRDHPERYLPADFLEAIDREDLAHLAQPVSVETED